MRQRLIPAEGFGKTMGLIALLNNLAQPPAGLLGRALCDAPGGRCAAWLATIEET
ncbi:hypothetical protein [Paraburkholderia heleia]|uniref:hypothetical protein n=1 Tax=Paraburkholderia heleia TaxID=634127 RepID=UPI002AB7C3DA|nr:hypothetical protein [Paraburkholderia heleia]